MIFRWEELTVRVESDMMMSSLESIRKSMKWYLFFHIIDMPVYNSFCLYKLKNGKILFADFHIKLIEEMIQEFYEVRPTGGVRHGDNPLRLTVRQLRKT